MSQKELHCFAQGLADVIDRLRTQSELLTPTNPRRSTTYGRGD